MDNKYQLIQDNIEQLERRLLSCDPTSAEYKTLLGEVVSLRQLLNDAKTGDLELRKANIESMKAELSLKNEERKVSLDEKKFEEEKKQFKIKNSFFARVMEGAVKIVPAVAAVYVTVFTVTKENDGMVISKDAKSFGEKLWSGILKFNK